MKRIYTVILCALSMGALFAGCSKGPDTQLGPVIKMTGAKDGPYIANLHEITAKTKAPTTDRGVWGGNMSRLAVNETGVYTAYMTGGGDGEAFPRPYTLYRLAPGASQWEAVASGESYTDSVVTLAGTDGKIYVATLGRNVREEEDFVGVYAYDPKDGSYTENAFEYSFSGSGYFAATISPEGRIFALVCGGGQPGDFAYISFDTAAGKFSKVRRFSFDYRHCYIHMHAGAGGELELLGGRDAHGYEIGYNIIEGKSFDYIFDGVRYWKINDAVKGEADYDTDLSIRHENPADYADMGDQRPTVMNNYTGDICWTADGEAHVLYTVSAKDTGMQTVTRHAIISGGKKIYDEKLWDGGSSLRMVRDAEGAFYLLKMNYGETKLELYRSAAEDGKSFKKYGEFDLSACKALAYAGLYIAKPEGGTPYDDTVDVIYPSNAAGATNTEQWNYFRLYLK